MKSLIAADVPLNTLIIVALVLFLFSIGAFGAGNDARMRAGTNGSVEGGVALGATGINGDAVVSPLGRGLDINQPPPGSLHIPVPANRRDPEDRQASRGSSAAPRSISFTATDLGKEAEHEEDALALKMRKR